MNKTFKVMSSHGYLTVELLGGGVVECIPNHDDEGSSSELLDIRAFDVEEWKATWKREIGEDEHVDILDLGFWTKGGDYTPPEEDWRQEIKRGLLEKDPRVTYMVWR